jgi:DNA-binding transcriptional LysR family regulator
MLSFRQLEAFTWTVRLKTLSRAAQRLNLAQPTVSKRVQELEAECGFPIFEKKGRSVDLTPRGHTLYLLAEQILALIQQVDEMRGVEDPPRRLVRIGVTELIAQTWLPKLVNLLAERFPWSVPRVSVEQGTALLSKLRSGELDLIVRTSFPPDAGIVDLAVSDVAISLMGSPRICDPGCVYDGAALSRLPFLIHVPSSGSVDALSTWMRDVGAKPEHMTEVDSLAAQVGMAVSSMGVALLPRELFRSLLKSGQLIELKTAVDIPPVQYRVAYRRHEQGSLIDRLARSVPQASDFTNGNQS